MSPLAVLPSIDPKFASQYTIAVAACFSLVMLSNGERFVASRVFAIADFELDVDARDGEYNGLVDIVFPQVCLEEATRSLRPG